MMQRMHKFVVLCLSVMILAGCASNVMTDFDSQAPFEQYQTYAFEPGAARHIQTLDGSRVMNAVDQTLNAKGFNKVPPDQADLWVRFRFEEELRYRSSGFSYGVGLFNRPFGLGLSTRPEVDPIMREKLVVELVEPQSNRVVWKGTGREYLTEDMGSRERTRLIDELITNMFERYPPEGAV